MKEIQNVKMKQESNTALNFFRRMQGEFVGELDFEDVAQKAVNQFTKDLGLIGLGLYRVDEENHRLCAVVYSDISAFEPISKLLPRRFSSMSVNLTSDNLLAKTVRLFKPQENHSLERYTQDVFSGFASKQIQKAIGVKCMRSVPVIYGEKCLGAIHAGISGVEFTSMQKQLLNLFAEQIGVALYNIQEHERLLHDFEERLRQKDNPKPEKASVKFTLRITPSMKKEIERQAIVAGMSKADFMRKLISNSMQENDSDVEEETVLQDDQSNEEIPQQMI